MKSWTNLLLFTFFSILLSYFLPAFPIDETRYLSVAWEMAVRKNYLLPTLNFQPYFHKPPLLFWLINFSWHLFGVRTFFARLTILSFSIGSLLLVKKIVLNLSQEERSATIATSLLSMTFGWIIFSVAIMFDMVLTFFSLLTIYLFILSAQKRIHPNLYLLTTVFLLGLLTKGPVFFLHTIPGILIFHFTQNPKEIRLKNTFNTLASATVAGMIAYFWLYLAARAAPGYTPSTILRVQTLERLVSPYAHANSVLYLLATYVAFFVPLLLFPRIIPAFVQGISQKTRLRTVSLGFSLPPLIFFLLSPTRQPQYLLPEMPLLIALVAHHYRPRFSLTRVQVALFSAILLATYLLWPIIDKYSLKSSLPQLCSLLQKNRICMWGKYHGEFNYSCRLTHPLKLCDEKTACTSKRKNDDLWILYDLKIKKDSSPDALLKKAIFSTPYKLHRILLVIPAELAPCPHQKKSFTK